MSDKQSIHGQWSSRWIFILAATGSAVGLGNIWKFPYITGEYGGGLFVLTYLICIAIIGIPVMIAEIMLGRRGRKSPINTMHDLSREEKVSPAWVLLGWGGVLAGFLILSYYSVIAGWALAYVFRAASGEFTGINADQSGQMFGDFIASPESLMAWHTIFMVSTMFVVARGVKRGLEKAVTWLMPMLFVLLILLIGYAINSGGFEQGVKFLFEPDISEIFYQCATDESGKEVCAFSFGPILTALGHAFFTLSLGMGAIMVYGSYMPSKFSIVRATLWIAGADTLVALLAGLAIFPIVFANDLVPGSGPGLIFTTLPIAFGNMAGGQFFGTMFFVLLVFAAWTSSISLIEPAVAWLVENRGMNRIWSSAAAGVVTWGVGLLTVMSFNDWAFSFNFMGMEKTGGVFDILDILTANIMLPLGGLLIALFAGWVMHRQACQDELKIGNGIVFRAWYVLIRYVSPIAVFLVLLKSVEII